MQVDSVSCRRLVLPVRTCLAFSRCFAGAHHTLLTVDRWVGSAANLGQVAVMLAFTDTPRVAHLTFAHGNCENASRATCQCLLPLFEFLLLYAYLECKSSDGSCQVSDTAPPKQSKTLHALSAVPSCSCRPVGQQAIVLQQLANRL